MREGHGGGGVLQGYVGEDGGEEEDEGQNHAEVAKDPAQADGTGVLDLGEAKKIFWLFLFCKFIPYVIRTCLVLSSTPTPTARRTASWAEPVARAA